MNFEDFFFSIESVAINEKRRNPDQNPREGIYELAEKYKDDPDVYISFVHEMDDLPVRSQTRNYIGSPKIGINPQSVYDTPSGIYTYPLQSVYDPDTKKLNIPFAFDAPIVYFVKRKSDVKGIEDIKHLPRDAYKKYVDKLVDVMVEMIPVMVKQRQPDADAIPINSHLLKLTIVNKSKENAKNQTFGGMLWNITRVASLIIGNLKNSDELMEWLEMPKNSSEISSSDIIDRLNSIYRFVIQRELSYPVLWNSIWRKILKVQYVADKSYSGIIHENEPSQAVFFAKNAFEVITVIKNNLNSNKQLTLYQTIQKYGPESEKTAAALYAALKHKPATVQKIKKLSKKFPYLATADFALRFMQHIFNQFIHLNPQHIKIALELTSANKKETDKLIQLIKDNFNANAFFYAILSTDPKNPKYIKEMETALQEQMQASPEIKTGDRRIYLDVPADSMQNPTHRDKLRVSLWKWVKSYAEPMFEVPEEYFKISFPKFGNHITINMDYEFDPKYYKELLKYIDITEVAAGMGVADHAIFNMFASMVNADTLQSQMHNILREIEKEA